MSSIKSKKPMYKGREVKRIHVTELMLVIFILLLVAINLILIIKNILTPKAKQETDTKLSKQQNIVQEENIGNTTSADYQLSQLKKGTERDRIEYYCGQFLGYIENKNYEKAYELLYPEFKQQYFPRIEEFTKYVQKTYPSILAIKYDDFDRQGDIYITTVFIDDALATNNKKQFSQRIIVQESDYNKYVLSFQVI